MSQPYRDHAHAYLRAGWAGVLWLRPGTKWPPPHGYTGWQGAWPSAADVQTWTEDHPDGNIALRLPEDVVGVDLDAYGTKRGEETLRELEAELGPLPKTIVSTSRDDGVSGIHLFHVPPGLSWPSQAGPDIEMIHFGHRYMVAWPSVHPDTGGIYRFIDQRTGEVLAEPPPPSGLPELPQTWVDRLQALTSGNGPTLKADVTHDMVAEWLVQLRQGKPCPRVTDAAGEGVAAVRGASRHDAMTRTTMQLVGYGAWGHAGVTDALAQVRAAFIDDLTHPGDGQRHVSEHEAVEEWRRAVAGAVAAKIEEFPKPSQVCSCPLPPFDPDIEESFWTARPELEHLRQFARARRSAPWAVLAIAMTRMLVAFEPKFVLPAIIGGRASLNLFVGVVARSGGGKGAAESAAADAIDLGKPIHSTGVGSGEGIVHQYVRRVPEDKKTGEPAYLDQYNDAVLFTAAEVDTLANLNSRQGSTLLAELRKLYMGEELSFAYVDPTKRLKLEKHKYRACLIVGIQPKRASALLDDADGGTPQRFAWVPGTDPLMPDVAPEEPPPLKWVRPSTSMMASPGGQVVLTVSDDIRRTVESEHIKRNRGEGDALDGHALLTRLKWAAAFAVLDARLDVTDDDWHLAGMLMTVSDHTRSSVVAELQAQRRAASVAQGLEHAEREVVKDDTVAERATLRVCQWIKDKTADGVERPQSELKNRLASRDRQFFGPALDRLDSTGDVEVRRDGNNVYIRGRVAA